MLITAFAVLAGTGGAGILVGLYWRWRPKTAQQRRRGGPFAIVSAISCAIGVGGNLLTSRLTAPGDTFVNTPTHFRSSVLAFELEAPPGWRLEFNRAENRLYVFEESLAGGDIPAAFIVDSSPMTEDLDLDRVVDMFKRVMESTGFTFEPFRAETFAGLPARSALGRQEEASVWLTIAARGRRQAVVVQCLVKKNGDPREACAAPRSRLAWVGPLDLPASVPAEGSGGAR